MTLEPAPLPSTLRHWCVVSSPPQTTDPESWSPDILPTNWKGWGIRCYDPIQLWVWIDKKICHSMTWEFSPTISAFRELGPSDPLMPLNSDGFESNPWYSTSTWTCNAVVPAKLLLMYFAASLWGRLKSWESNTSSPIDPHTELWSWGPSLVGERSSIGSYLSQTPEIPLSE